MTPLCLNHQADLENATTFFLGRLVCSSTHGQLIGAEKFFASGQMKDLKEFAAGRRGSVLTVRDPEIWSRCPPREPAFAARDGNTEG
jgi:hypothetical protein